MRPTAGGTRTEGGGSDIPGFSERRKRGDRIGGVPRHAAPLVQWLTRRGRYKLGAVTANDR